MTPWKQLALVWALAAMPSTSRPQAGAASSTRASAARVREAPHCTAIKATHASMPTQARPWPALQATANQVAW